MRRVCHLLLVLALAALSAQADTIVLKTGRRISATSVVEEGDRVCYETRAGRLSFPKSAVERIERGGFADFGGRGAAEPPVTPPRVDPGEGFDEVMKATLAGGSVDRNYLARLEEQASSGAAASVNRVAMGYHAAAQFFVRRGDFDRAIEHYRRGLSFAPEHMGLLVSISELYLAKSQYTEALQHLERAQRLEPKNADVAKLIGWAYHGQNKIEQAVKEWKRAYELRPDFDVVMALEKAQRDAEAESAYREGESRHFVLRYNGEAAPELARGLLRTLEQHFRTLESELNFTPPEPIGVVLYTDEEYFDITRSPMWSAAVNDGRIRVPVQGLRSISSELSQTLMHELTHSFLAQKTRGRCPTWLHEGIAQWMEGRRSTGEVGVLIYSDPDAEDGVGVRLLPLSLMEGSWNSLPGDMAYKFYVWSLSVVEYIIRTNGMADIERLLSRLATEPSTQAALLSTLRVDYAELEKETARYLRRTSSPARR